MEQPDRVPTGPKNDGNPAAGVSRGGPKGTAFKPSREPGNPLIQGSQASRQAQKGRHTDSQPRRSRPRGRTPTKVGRYSNPPPGVRLGGFSGASRQTRSTTSLKAYVNGEPIRDIAFRHRVHRTTVLGRHSPWAPRRSDQAWTDQELQTAARLYASGSPSPPSANTSASTQPPSPTGSDVPAYPSRPLRLGLSPLPARNRGLGGRLRASAGGRPCQAPTSLGGGGLARSGRRRLGFDRAVRVWSGRVQRGS